MELDSSYAIETRTKTRNLGLVMSVLLVPVVCAFMFIDHSPFQRRKVCRDLLRIIVCPGPLRPGNEWSNGNHGMAKQPSADENHLYLLVKPQSESPVVMRCEALGITVLRA